MRTAWREFMSSSNVAVQQALSAQQANRMAGSRPPPFWAILAILFLGWNEFMAVLWNPVRRIYSYAHWRHSIHDIIYAAAVLVYGRTGGTQSPWLACLRHAQTHVFTNLTEHCHLQPAATCCQTRLCHTPMRSHTLAHADLHMLTMLEGPSLS